MIYDCFPFNWKNEDLIMCCLLLCCSQHSTQLWYTFFLLLIRSLDLWQKLKMKNRTDRTRERWEKNCNVQRSTFIYIVHLITMKWKVWLWEMNSILYSNLKKMWKVYLSCGIEYGGCCCCIMHSSTFSLHSISIDYHHHIRVDVALFLSKIARNLISYLVGKISEDISSVWMRKKIADFFFEIIAWRETFRNFIKYPTKLYSENHQRVSVSNSKFLRGEISKFLLQYESSSQFSVLSASPSCSISHFPMKLFLFSFSVSHIANPQLERTASLNTQQWKKKTYHEEPKGCWAGGGGKPWGDEGAGRKLKVGNGVEANWQVSK